MAPTPIFKIRLENFKSKGSFRGEGGGAGVVCTRGPNGPGPLKVTIFCYCGPVEWTAKKYPSMKR